VDLRTGSASAGPLTYGVFSHTILLPLSANDWTPARRRLVLAHEMAHVKRHDGAGQLLCQIVCAVYWFNPLVWYAVRRLRIERERACDDCVLGLDGNAPDYADHLLQIARGLNAGPALTAVSMAHPSQLKSRVIAILDSGIRRNPMSRFTTFLLLSATAALTVSLGVVRVKTLAATPLPALLMPLHPPPTAIPEPPAQPVPAAAAAVQQTSPGYVVNRLPVAYPADAMQKRIEGTVAIELSFNARGEIVDSRVLSGPEELRQAALQTAVTGKYAINLARSLQVLVEFKLPAPGSTRMSGSVANSLRASLPGATVTATNKQTGVVATAVTDPAGEYRFVDLLPGAYRVNVRLDGFQPLTFENVSLGDSQQVRLNFDLASGDGAGAPDAAAQATPIRTRPDPGVLNGVDIRGLEEPLLSEMRQKLQPLQGLPIGSDLLNQVRALIRSSVWGEKPVGFIVSPRTGASSDLLISFFAPPTSANGVRIRIGGNVAAGNLIQQVKPVYPAEAKEARIQGVVVLEIDITAVGLVGDVRVITGHPLLLQSAIDAVRQWVYKPQLVNGQPVDVVTIVTVNFAFQQ
jgi:TonB family protein